MIVSYNGCLFGFCLKYFIIWLLSCVFIFLILSVGVCFWFRGMIINVVSVRSGIIIDKEISGLKICLVRVLKF